MPHPAFPRQACGQFRIKFSDPARRQRGGVAPFAALGLAGALVAMAYTLDTTRLSSDASQLKRATDAAAVAVAREYAVRGDDFAEKRDQIAGNYVRSNMGMDSQLQRTVAAVTVTQGSSGDGNPTFSVEASFTTDTGLGGNTPQTVTVHSTAEVRVAFTEVSLLIPNTSTEAGGEMTALRRLGKTFARNLIEGSSNSWLALVPFSQIVNVYDAEHPTRITAWARPDALRPKELTSLFRTGYRGLHDTRMPDLKSKRVCLYRGLDLNESYLWDQPPNGQFRIHYRHDLPENAPNEPSISWRGPNPDFGMANGAEDIRYIIGDKGCPRAPLLPLTNDLDKIEARLDAMSPGFNVNYAIAMGWGAMALAPAFQGDDGWGAKDNLPQEFDDGSGERQKAVILLAKTTDTLWFDTDAYNHYVGRLIGNGNNDDDTITRRFANLCASMRARRLRFFLVATGTDEGRDDDGDQVASASAFRRIAGPGLQACAQEAGDLTYLGFTNFAEGEEAIAARLKDIVKKLRQDSSFVRLIE